ncbi:MAG: hypothetical protein GY716_17885 [bacterium]|nr:hypothetical protein [bacterium]
MHRRICAALIALLLVGGVASAAPMVIYPQDFYGVLFDGIATITPQPPLSQHK